MGFPGEATRPEVIAACADAIRRIRAAGKPAGTLSAAPAYLEACIAAGSLFTAVGVDMGLLRAGALAAAKTWRDRI